MEEAGFEKVRVYITRRQNTVAWYILTQPILDLYERSVLRPGSWVSWWWWEKEGIDIKGEKERATLDSDGEDYKCGEGAAQEETPGWN